MAILSVAKAVCVGLKRFHELPLCEFSRIHLKFNKMKLNLTIDSIIVPLGFEGTEREPIELN